MSDRRPFYPLALRLCALPIAATLLLGVTAEGRVRHEGKVVALTLQPGSALESTARRLVASDVRESDASGNPPVLLVGSAPLAGRHGAEALFVQVQSASFCGSAGCSTSIFLKRGDGWKKVMDSISGPIKVSARTHRGMHDLILHAGDRWVWNGASYVDTLPTPTVDLRHSTKG